MSLIDVCTLQKMLKPPGDSDSDSDADCVKYTPADIGKTKPSKSKIPDVRFINYTSISLVEYII